MISRIDNITSVPDIQGSTPIVRYSEEEIQTIVDSYVERLPIIPRTASPEGDVDGFFDKIHDAIISRQNSDGVPESKRLLFMADLPPQEDEVDMEAITYCLISRKPGLFQKGSANDNGIREVSSHQRYIIKDPEHPGQKLVTMGRFYDNVIKFNIYARTDKVAIQRLLWFQRVMNGFNWYFKLNGYRVVELGMDERKTEKQGGLKLTKYPMSYFVRTDDTFHISTQELKRLVLNMELSKQ